MARGGGCEGAHGEADEVGLPLRAGLVEKAREIKGHFELASGRLDFALAFQHVRRRWLLFGIYAQPAAPAFAAPAGAAQSLLKGGEPSPDPPPAKGEQ